ncbi:DUF6350 family protein [Corynebacterium nuruki]|uniref:cell division protein PerM n=1 Tax=Corynebacterium nuruki TaxID=1032851 RepID=UPI0039BFC05B
MESQRHGGRSQRNSRGPEPRRRRTGTYIDPNASRREQREAAQERLSRRGAGRARGDEGFVAGAHGAPASRDHGARQARGVPVPDAEGADAPARPRATSPDARRPRSGFRGRVADWWETWGPHIRRFLPTVVINHAVTLALICAVAVVIGVGGSLRAVPAMIGSFWMLVNLAPVNFSGSVLGVAPLLPALLILFGHARRVRSACGNRISVRDIRAFGALAVIVPAVVTVIAWLMLWDASHVFDVSPPNILVALLTTVVFNGVVFIVGLGPRIWRALLLRRGLPTWPVESVLLAGRFSGVLLAAGAVAVIVQLLLNTGGVSAAYDISGGAAGALGLTLLSLLYLPNLAVGGAAVLMGGEMHVGDASASLFAVTNANLPPLPLLAAMPNGDLRFAPVLLVVPAVLAIGTVYFYLRGRSYVEAPLWTAVGGGVAAAVIGFLLAWAGGGTLGYFGGVGALLWLTPLLFLGWLLVPTLIVLLWIARVGRSVTETAADIPDTAEDEEDVEDAEDAEVEGATADTDDEGVEDAEDAEAEAEANVEADSVEDTEVEAGADDEDEDRAEESDTEPDAESDSESDTEPDTESDSESDTVPDTGEADSAESDAGSEAEEDADDGDSTADR